MIQDIKRYLFVASWIYKNRKKAYYLLEDSAIRAESVRLVEIYKEQRARDCN